MASCRGPVQGENPQVNISKGPLHGTPSRELAPRAPSRTLRPRDPIQWTPTADPPMGTPPIEHSRGPYRVPISGDPYRRPIHVTRFKGTSSGPPSPPPSADPSRTLPGDSVHEAPSRDSQMDSLQGNLPGDTPVPGNPIHGTPSGEPHSETPPGDQI